MIFKHSSIIITRFLCKCSYTIRDRKDDKRRRGSEESVSPCSFLSYPTIHSGYLEADSSTIERLTFNGMCRYLLIRTADAVPGYLNNLKNPIEFYSVDGSPGVPLIDFERSTPSVSQLSPPSENLACLVDQVLVFGVSAILCSQ